MNDEKIGSNTLKTIPIGMQVKYLCPKGTATLNWNFDFHAIVTINGREVYGRIKFDISEFGTAHELEAAYDAAVKAARENDGIEINIKTEGK